MLSEARMEMPARQVAAIRDGLTSVIRSMANSEEN
jgi:hypothetical protein